MKAKIYNFLQRGSKTYFNVNTFMDGSDAYSMDDLAQKYNLGVTDGERDNQVIVTSDGNIRVFTRAECDTAKLLTALMTFDPHQLPPNVAAKIVGSLSEPFDITTGSNDGLMLAFDGGSASGVTLTPSTAATSASVLGTVAETFNVQTGVNDSLKIAIDGGAPLTFTLTAGAARTALQVASDINTGLGATIATVSSGKILLTSTTTGASSEINIETVANDAYTLLGFTVSDNTGTAKVLRTAAQIAANINGVFPGVASSAGGVVTLTSTVAGPTSKIQTESATNPAYATLGITEPVTATGSGPKVV